MLIFHRSAIVREALCRHGADYAEAGPHQEVPAVPQLCLQADCGEPPALRPRHRRTEPGGLPLRGSPALQVVQPDALLPVGPGWYHRFTPPAKCAEATMFFQIYRYSILTTLWKT